MTRRHWWFVTAIGAVAMVVAINLGVGSDDLVGSDQPVRVATYGYQVVRTFPHDPQAFTQGLIYRDGFLYESTGINGRSSLRKVRLETGEVLQRRVVDAQYFAEGLTDWGNRLIQLTWQTHIGFSYDINTFAMNGTFSYTGEGWGLTRDKTRIIMSDGTPTLRFLDPVTLKELSRLTVKDGATPVQNLNELEFIKGEIYANIWMTDRIARIAPTTGQVTGWVDLSGLLSAADRAASAPDVLNGIAYDPTGDRLFVTGKDWPKLFEIKVVPVR